MSTLKANSYQHVDRGSPSIIINSDGSVSISSTVTYEDVTSVDAVGVITGRSNADLQNRVNVGSGVSIKAGGLNVTAGISTFQAITGTTGTFTGDVDIADKIIHTGDTNTAIRFPGADIFTAETGGSERLRCDSDGVKALNGRFYSAGTYAFIESSSDTYTTLTLRKTHSDADSIDYLQCRDNSNSIKLIISGDGTVKILDSITHEGDTNTKIRFPAADTFTVETAGSERLRIDSSGRVLIGNTASSMNAAADNLIVGGSSGHHGITVYSGADADGWLIFNDGDNSNLTGAVNYNHASNYMAFRTSTTEALRIASDGKVGISTGTISPDGNQLLIRAASTFQTTKGHIMLTGDGATNGEGPQIVFSESGSGSNFAGAYIGHVRTSTNSVGDLVFGTRATGGDANTVPTERLRLRSDGTVDIGSGSHSRNLTVHSTTNCVILIEGNSDATSNLMFGDQNDEDVGMIQYNHVDNDLAITVNASERLTINSSGNANFTGIVTATSFVPTNGQLGGRRNLIKNGSMKIFQRYSSAGSSGDYAADRWQVGFQWTGSNTITMTANQDVTGPDVAFDMGLRKYIRIGSNGSSGDLAADWFQLEQVIEAQDVANSGWDYNTTSSYISVSFFARSTVGYGPKFMLLSNDGTVKSWAQTFVTTTAWQRYEFNIPGHADLTFNNDTGQGLRVFIIPYYGTNYTGSTTLGEWHTVNSADYFADMSNQTAASSTYTDITGFQVEVSDQATPFEHRLYQDDLRDCQRYYFEYGVIGSTIITNAINNNPSRVPMPEYPVRMRANPTLTTNNTLTEFSAGTTHTVSSFNQQDLNGGGYIQLATNLTNGVYLRFKADAEF